MRRVSTAAHERRNVSMKSIRSHWASWHWSEPRFVWKPVHLRREGSRQVCASEPASIVCTPPASDGKL